MDFIVPLSAAHVYANRLTPQKGSYDDIPISHTGVQSVDNSQQSKVINAPITQNINASGFTADQLSGVWDKNNAQLIKHVEGKLTKEVVPPQGRFGNAITKRVIRVRYQ